MSVVSTEPPPTAGNPTRSWAPTRKWIAATITALGAVTVLWLQAGSMTVEVRIALVGVIVQAMVAYLVPNQDTPGGAPLKEKSS